MDIQLDEKEVEEVLNEAINKLYIPYFEKLGMNASGQWKNNVEARGTAIWGMDYTEFLAKGRSANSDQSPEALRAWAGWAGSTFIKQWLDDKGLNLNPYAVAMNIAKKGTTWKEKGGSDILKFLNSDEFLDFLREGLRQKLGSKIAYELSIYANLTFKR